MWRVRYLNGVTGIFSAALCPWGQPVKEVRTRNISWGEGGRCVGLSNVPPSCADCLEIWKSQPSGTPTSCLSPLQVLRCTPIYIICSSFKYRYASVEDGDAFWEMRRSAILSSSVGVPAET
jgi:hypothetical protein